MPDSSGVPAFDDIPSNQSIPKFDELPDHNSIIGATAEGVAQGVAGPAAPWAESHPATTAMLASGPAGWASLLADKITGNTSTSELDKSLAQMGHTTPEEISSRQSEHSVAHGVGEAAGFAGSLLSGVGAGAEIGEAANALSKGMPGAAAIKLFLEGAGYAGSDEITKALLGHGDPQAPVKAALVNMTATGLMNVAGGGLFNLVGHGLGSLTSEKMIGRATQAISDFAKDKPFTNLAELAASYYTGKHGTSGVFEGLKSSGYALTVIKKLFEPIIEKIVGKPLTKANQYVGDVILSTLSKNSPASIPAAMEWANKISKGNNAITDAIGAVMKGASGQIAPPAKDFVKQQLKDAVEKGVPQQQMQDELQNSGSMAGYAKGGTVSEQAPPHDHFGSAFPEQNILLNQAKGRVYQYLNSIRPLSNPKLPFDEAMHDAEKHRSYDKAISLAVSPLEILNHVQKGDLTPEHMKHFHELWPEIHDHLSRKLTEEITKAQLSGKKPRYGKRQAMSLFLGAELDSSMTPQAIQAAQGVFAQKQAAQQQQAAPKKGKASLSKSADAYRTDDESVQARQQKI